MSEGSRTLIMLGELPVALPCHEQCPVYVKL